MSPIFLPNAPENDENANFASLFATNLKLTTLLTTLLYKKLSAYESSITSLCD
jgi:hypothetical protein